MAFHSFSSYAGLRPGYCKLHPHQVDMEQYVILRWLLKNAVLETVTIPAGKGDVDYYWWFPAFNTTLQ